MDPISLVRIDAAHELVSWFRRAYAEYLRGLSPLAPGAYSLDESGVWQPDLAPFWLSDPNTRCLVALAAERPFGFACVGTSAFPYKDPTSDHCLAEFYVQASSRGRGLGAALAALTLGGLPGKWELSVLRGNIAALEFWRRVLPSIASSSPLETTEPHQVAFRFTVGSSAACG
jgi:predicted acetyltransferase